MDSIRQASDQNCYTADKFPRMKLTDFSNGEVIFKKEKKYEKKDVFLPYHGNDWKEQFNKPELTNLKAEWHNDIRFLRHMYEIWDPTVQTIKTPYAALKPFNKDQANGEHMVF